MLKAHAEAFLLLGREPELRHRMGVAGWQRAKDCFSSQIEREELRKVLDFQ